MLYSPDKRRSQGKWKREEKKKKKNDVAEPADGGGRGGGWVGGVNESE